MKNNHEWPNGNYVEDNSSDPGQHTPAVLREVGQSRKSR